MIGNQDIQANIESFIQNLLKAKVIEEKKIQELKNLNEKELDEGNYTSFEKNLCALIKGTFECAILLEIVTDPIALITQDKNGKQIANIVSRNSLNENLKIPGNKAHLDPFNRQEIVKIVTPERIYESFINYKKEQAQQAINNIAQPNPRREAMVRPVQLAMDDHHERVLERVRQAQEARQAEQTQNFNSSDSSKNDFFKSHHGKIVAATTAISGAVGFLIGGPAGALLLAAGGAVIGLCIASLINTGLKSYHASKKSTNDPTQNMPFLNRHQQNNNQSNESTSGLPNLDDFDFRVT